MEGCTGKLDYNDRRFCEMLSLVGSLNIPVTSSVCLSRSTEKKNCETSQVIDFCSLIKETDPFSLFLKGKGIVTDYPFSSK
jgi:hypothetical protein